MERPPLLSNRSGFDRTEINLGARCYNSMNLGAIALYSVRMLPRCDISTFRGELFRVRVGVVKSAFRPLDSTVSLSSPRPVV